MIRLIGRESCKNYADSLLQSNNTVSLLVIRKILVLSNSQSCKIIGILQNHWIDVKWQSSKASHTKYFYSKILLNYIYLNFRYFKVKASTACKVDGHAAIVFTYLHACVHGSICMYVQRMMYIATKGEKLSRVEKLEASLYGRCTREKCNM